MKLNVIVELKNDGVYEGCFEVEEVKTRTQSELVLKEIVEEVIEEFETTNITIKVYGEVVYKNNKMVNKNLLYICGSKYQKLINLYQRIL